MFRVEYPLNRLRHSCNRKVLWAFDQQFAPKHFILNSVKVFLLEWQKSHASRNNRKSTTV